MVTGAAPREPARHREGRVQVRRLPALRLRALAPSQAELLSFCATAAVRLGRELEAFRADGVIAYFAVPAGPFAVRAARKLDVPVLVSLRGSDVPGFPGGRLEGRLGLMTRPIVRRTLDAASVVAPNSVALRDLALRFAPEVAPKTIIVPNGIDAATIASRPAGAGSRTLEIIQVGQLIERKRVDLAIKAMLELGREGVDARLTLVGDGPLRERLVESVRQHGLADRVIFGGLLAREQVTARLRSSDLYLSTSEGEGMSNALLEATAAGLPVVTTRSGSHDVVEQAGNGLVVASTPVAVAAALGALARDAEARRSRAEAGLAWAHRHTWAETARSFVELLVSAGRAV